MFSSQRGNGLHSQRQADRYRFAGVVGGPGQVRSTSTAPHLHDVEDALVGRFPHQ